MVNSKESEHSKRTSAQVAPLTIHKGRPRGNSSASVSKHKRNTSSKSSNQNQITPPATPNGSREDLNQMEHPPPVFSSFLRAYYPFHPTYAGSDSTVTLPLNVGDVVLVHSVHTNGWADGTLLITGARGWLPTNYCQPYDPDAMRNLLKALLNFWDLLRSGLTTDSEIFGNQQFMRGIIAGVRYLLEKSNCLTRESPIVQNNDSLRKNRKALLADLSALVKTAKQLQDFGLSPGFDKGSVNDVIDEMILKAFKITMRGIRFLDNLDEDIKSREPLQKIMATVAEESNVPPTPPADSTSFSGTPHTDPAYDTASHRSSIRSSASGPSIALRSEDQNKRQSYKRISTAHPTVTSRPLSISSTHAKRASVSHRVSLIASVPAEQCRNLISEKLTTSHDTFLSHLGSFIGRLHLQSQSAQDLLATVRQSVTAGQGLLIVVEAVCTHDSQSADLLDNARNVMYDKINQLALAARDIISESGIDEDDVVMAQQNGGLLMAATGCVKAAGEAVAKTKFVIERIGDFEFVEGEGLGINVSSRGAVPAQGKTAQEHENGDEASEQPPARAQPPPLVIPNVYEKPLPEVPISSTPTTETNQMSNRLSNTSILPPLPKMGGPLMSQEDYSPSDRASTSDSEFQSFRSDSIAVSSTGTSSGYLRDSEISMVSQASTRATTPDITSHKPRNQSSMSSISMSESQSTFADDPYDLESKILEKTFAHELVHNKEGQITGGSLAALVERLTTHDSTPDSMFVSTFYLTFRSFATPTELATALVDRFEYVGESPHISGPVRLRVYNVFKGWLESHWRNVSDNDALFIIESFASDKLKAALPAASKRLQELAQKVSSIDGPLVPRLVSSIGKTSTSFGQHTADSPVPPVVVTKSQAAVLKNWKMGGSNPAIIEFDPIELARQLTIKEMNIFSSIMPDELLGAAWTKARKGGPTAVNVIAMSTLSTDLSNLVADTILQFDDVKKRASVIKHWIKIAHECLKLNNYDTLMAVICSLNSSTIGRLKKTWELVSQKRKDLLKALQDVVEPEKNYAVLRRRLHDHIPPCLPFVGTYLTDLTFVDAGNPATKQLADGTSVINFDKHTRTAKIIGELQRFQIPYRLAEVPELQEWIQAQIVRVKTASESENVQQYYRKSLLLEPRDISHTRPSPVDSAVSFSSSHGKDKFDLFGWAHSSKDKTQTPI